MTDDNYALVFDFSPYEIWAHFNRGGEERIKKYSLLPRHRRRYTRFRALLDLVGKPRKHKNFWMYGKYMHLSMEEYESLKRG